MLAPAVLTTRLVVPLVVIYGLGACNGSVKSPEKANPIGDVGTVTVHRLNNTEYANTVRDLLGTSLEPTRAFPADDYSHGFDNISSVLSMSPVQVELYQGAAHDLAAEAMRPALFEEQIKVEAEDVGGPEGRAVVIGQDPAGSVGGEVTAPAWEFFLPGSITATLQVESAGSYALEVRSWARQAGPELAKMDVSINGERVTTFEIDALIDAPKVYTFEHELPRGPVEITLGFPNDYHVPEQNLDRNLYIDWIALRGPVGANGETPGRDHILLCDPTIDAAEERAECVRKIVAHFGERAWRRPLTSDEVDAKVALVEEALLQGGSVDDGIQQMVEHFLSSPHFLFRFEIDPDPFSSEPRALSDYELASRLSYFLWSSMPDEELFELARAGELGSAVVLAEQVQRMLADSKAEALVENFAAQWLYLRGLAGHNPDAELFPDFDEALKEAMFEETSRFFREFLSSDLPVGEMLTAEFTYVNERLATHYGLPAPADGFERLSLAGTGRRGLLTQGSLLTVTSHPDRTSPVKRGQWVLEQLLCSAPPPPPPGVEGLDGEDGPIEGSIRERMEQHRTDPACSSCHEAMDPIGFSLEHFDGVGAWRDVDGIYEIDTTGQLPTGERFDGVTELAPILANDPRFTHCMTEKMLTYALGRGMEAHDEVAVDRIHDKLLARGASLRDLIVLIVQSDRFLYRRGESEGL